MTKAEHIEKHKALHRSFDELMADFISHTDKLPSQTSIMDLMKWSFEQTQNPSELEGQDGSKNR